MRACFKLLLAGLGSAFVAGCGTPVQAPRDDSEVNIGYETVTKEARTGSVSSVDVKDTELMGIRDIYDYLEGRVAGVMVTTDKRILIRGANTVNGSTEPLILVDGQERQDISTINPLDIKSVDVLKGSSTAIYGVRGSNGVILITTKK